MGNPLKRLLGNRNTGAASGRATNGHAPHAQPAQPETTHAANGLAPKPRPRETTPAPPRKATPRRETKPVVSVRNLTKVYAMGDQQIRALNGINFDLWPGEMVAVMGPSGSGKSTFMNIIGCLDVPTGGTYLLDGIDVSKLNDTQLAAIRGGKIGFVFQNFNLLPRTTAVANVELPLIYAGVGGRERRRRAIESLTLVGLEARVNHKPNELSGGQQQRVAIARALVNRPALILADEPTGNLDTKTSQEIMELFQRLSREQKMTILLITHEPEITEYCDRIVHIRDGVLLDKEIGAGDPAATHPHAARDDDGVVARALVTGETGRDDAAR